MARSISAKAISGFVRAIRYPAGTPARSNRARLLVQLSGRNSRNASMTGTSPRASVSDIRVWQFAVLPSAEAYCAATPTECVPFLGIAVSSMHGIAAADEPIRLVEDSLDISITGFAAVEIDQITTDFEDDSSDPVDAVDPARSQN